MTDLPSAALEAAREYYVEHWDDAAGGRVNPLYARDFITGLATAMVPAIRAAERARIRALAAEYSAKCHRPGASYATPFADLIGEHGDD